MECIRKLSNFHFQWTKTLYKNNLKHITFFFTLLKGYRCNVSYLYWHQRKFTTGTRENKFHIKWDFNNFYQVFTIYSHKNLKERKKIVFGAFLKTCIFWYLKMPSVVDRRLKQWKKCLVLKLSKYVWMEPNYRNWKKQRMEPDLSFCKRNFSSKFLTQ